MFRKTNIKSTAQLLVIIIVLAAIFSHTAAVYAAPIKDMPAAVIQPDGTVLECFASGDEFFNYLHDADGNIIIQHPATGYYTYAMLDDIGKVTASDNIAYSSNNLNGSDNIRLYGSKSGIKVTDIDFTVNADLIHKFPQEPDSQDSSQSFAITASAVRGIMENVVVLICFADENPYISPADTAILENVFNGDGNSLKGYMKAVSGGIIEINSTIAGMDGAVTFMYQDDKPRNYYQPYNAVTNPGGYTNKYEGDPDSKLYREQTMLVNAVNAIADSPLLAGKNLDIDNNGIIDSIAFIINGSSAGWNDLLWPHKWEFWGEYKAYINGKRAGSYSFQLLDWYINPSSNSRAVSVTCHETLHTFKLPDLYRYDSAGTPAGSWDVMASEMQPAPQFPNTQLQRRYAGWGNAPLEITQNGTYTLFPLGGGNGITSYIINTANPEEFILLEYRDIINGSGFDNYIESGSYASGLTISRINEKWTGNANSGEPHSSGGTYGYEVYFYRPDETGKDDGGGNIEEASLSDTVGRTAFGNDNNNNTVDFGNSIYLESGANTNYIISDVVKNTNGTISFHVKIKEETPDTVIVTHIAGNNGTVNTTSGSSGSIVTSGTNITFTALPDTNYVVDKWFVDGHENTTAGHTLTLNAVTESTTVIVTFKLDLSAVTAAPVISLTALSSGTTDFGAVPNGDTVTVTISDNSGADIYYTTDGTMPNTSSNIIVSGSSFNLKSSGFGAESIRVIAYAVEDSKVPSEFVYEDIQFLAAELTVDLDDPSAVYLYNGSPKTPAVTVKASNVILNENTDYELIYRGNIYAGTASITAVGKGSYDGYTGSATFTISATTYTGSAGKTVYIRTNDPSVQRYSMTAKDLFPDGDMPAGAKIKDVNGVDYQWVYGNNRVCRGYTYNGTFYYYGGRSNSQNIPPNLEDTLYFTITTANYDDIIAEVTFESIEVNIVLNGNIKGFTDIAPPYKQQVTVMLIGDTFAESLNGSWITNLPSGLEQNVTRADNTTAVITVSGTPAGASIEQIAVTIPAGALMLNTKGTLTAASVAGAVYDIVAPTYRLESDGGIPDSGFAPLDYGYENGRSVVYTLTNTGNQTVTDITAVITESEFKAGILPFTTLAPGDSATVTVAGITGLDAGTYTGILKVTWTNDRGKNITEHLSQTVSKIDYTDSIEKKVYIKANYPSEQRRSLTAKDLFPDGSMPDGAVIKDVNGTDFKWFYGANGVCRVYTNNGALYYYSGIAADAQNIPPNIEDTFYVTIETKNYTNIIVEVTFESIEWSAALSGTVTGYTNTALKDTHQVTVTLTGDTFAESLSGNWITNLPLGLAQSVTRTGNTTAVITVSGTPSASSTVQIAVTIPTGNLVIDSGNTLTVTQNADAVYDIVTLRYVTAGTKVGDIKNMPGSNNAVTITRKNYINNSEEDITKSNNAKLGTGTIIKDDKLSTTIVIVENDLTGNGETNLEDAQLYLEALVGNYELDRVQQLAVEVYVDDSAIKRLRAFLNAVMIAS